MASANRHRAPRPRAGAVAASVVGVVIVVAGAVVGLSRLHSNGLDVSIGETTSVTHTSAGPLVAARRPRPRSPPVPSSGSASSTASTTSAPAPTGPGTSSAAPGSPAAATPPKAVPKTSTASAPAPAPASGNTIFSDKFAGSCLSSAWTVISRHGEYAQNETECNTPSRYGASNMLEHQHDRADDELRRSQPRRQCAARGRELALSDRRRAVVEFQLHVRDGEHQGRYPAQEHAYVAGFLVAAAGCQADESGDGRDRLCDLPRSGRAGLRRDRHGRVFDDTWCQLALAQPATRSRVSVLARSMPTGMPTTWCGRRSRYHVCRRGPDRLQFHRGRRLHTSRPRRCS